MNELDKVRSYLDNNILKDISLKDLTKISGFSQEHTIRLFKKEFGTILCPEIHKQLFGRTFDFTDPKELEMYMNMEGRCEKCAQTVARAVRITCEMLMEDED